MGKSRSNYLGLRATVTASPDGRWALVSVAAKRSDARWDEWETFLPVRRVDTPRLSSTEDAIRFLSEALEVALGDLSEQA